MLVFRKQLSLQQQHNLMKSYDNLLTRMDSLLCQKFVYFTHGHHLTLLNHNLPMTTYHQLPTHLSMQQHFFAISQAVPNAGKQTKDTASSSKFTVEL